MHIAFLDSATIDLEGDIDFSAFSPFDSYINYAKTSPEEIIDHLTGVDVAMTNKAMITREVLEQTNLQHVAVVATGVNNVDLDAASEYGVTVSNVPGYASNSVPQHVFALILNLATQTYQYDRDVHQGDWAKADTFTLLNYKTIELSGKTIGIIGFGSIGRQVAKIAEAFGMRVLMNRKSGLPAEGYECSSLEIIYEQSDVISLSTPLSAENKYMINKGVLVKMKPSAFLINTARGPLVNQTDLADALNQGVIAGAGIDVLDEEPPKNGNPLLTAKNCIITPHSAWSTVEARQRLLDEVVLNIKSFANGQSRNIVN